MVYLTRKCEFSASHYYHNPEFSAEENQRIFGKCANLNGHGHNYTLEVTVKGDVDPQTGSSTPYPVDDFIVSNIAHVAGGGLRAHDYWDNTVEVVPGRTDTAG